LQIRRFSMPSVFDVLDEIEKYPGMYVGGDDSQRGLQLQNIELLLFGYALALRAHNIDEPVKDFVHEFGEYLWRKYEWSAACGPVAAIRGGAKDDDEAWSMFWQLVREYRISLGK
jgi:hypothetical protein